ncbi:MAG: DUF2812 domain-containing protein [Spirochaetaceae bacterium]|nr:DUF2812 domain-containing protein [Spirochaetaceae bacterium]
MSEIKTVRKLFLAWDFEKEEQWLNEMAQSGWTLCNVHLLKYTFKKSDPSEYTIRLEYHIAKDVEDYISFVEETGAEYIGNVFRWLYFRKKLKGGESFKLLTDIDSLIKRLDHICCVMALVTVANLLIVVAQIGNGLNRPLNLVMGLLGLYGTFKLLRKRQNLSKRKIITE